MMIQNLRFGTVVIDSENGFRLEWQCACACHIPRNWVFLQDGFVPSMHGHESKARVDSLIALIWTVIGKEKSNRTRAYYEG